MKIIKPSVEFFGEVPTDYDNSLKFIEMAGRTCYKSEDKITEDSAKIFVKRLIKSGHLAMVEHSNFVIRTIQEVSVSAQEFECLYVGKFLNKYFDNKYYYIGGNLTAWYQYFIKNGFDPIFDPFLEIYGDLFNVDFIEGGCGQWQVCPHNEIPKDLHRYSTKFICDRGVSHELVRHRPCSFAQESTRYVNYSGKNMEFIEPYWFDGLSDFDRNIDTWKSAMLIAEKHYKYLINGRQSTQQARAVLPNSVKTEIVVTADAAEWKHIRKLRTDKASHPDMQRIMNMMTWNKFLT